MQKSFAESFYLNLITLISTSKDSILKLDFEVIFFYELPNILKQEKTTKKKYVVIYHNTCDDIVFRPCYFME